MNVKALQVKLISLAIGLLAFFGICSYLCYVILSSAAFWREASPLMAAAWVVVTLLVVPFSIVAGMAARTGVLIATAAMLRGEYGFYWDHGAHHPHFYSEWAYERRGFLQMGMRLGRLQVVLYGMPRSLPGVAAA